VYIIIPSVVEELSLQIFSCFVLGTASQVYVLYDFSGIKSVIINVIEYFVTLQVFEICWRQCHLFNECWPPSTKILLYMYCFAFTIFHSSNTLVACLQIYLYAFSYSLKSRKGLSEVGAIFQSHTHES
jgi:hypothetical protein